MSIADICESDEDYIYIGCRCHKIESNPNIHQIIALGYYITWIFLCLNEVDRPNFEQKRDVYIACDWVDKEVDGQQQVDEWQISALP